MNKGDLVLSLNNEDWPCPGVIIRGPYGTVEKIEASWDGKALLTNETKVVDVLLGSKIYSRIPIENLKVVK